MPVVVALHVATLVAPFTQMVREPLPEAVASTRPAQPLASSVRPSDFRAAL